MVTEKVHKTETSTDHPTMQNETLNNVLEMKPLRLTNDGERAHFQHFQLEGHLYKLVIWGYVYYTTISVSFLSIFCIFQITTIWKRKKKRNRYDFKYINCK